MRTRRSSIEGKAEKLDFLTNLSGIIAFVLATGYAIASAFLPPLNVKTLSDIVLPYWATVFTLVIVYIYGRTERLQTTTSTILARPFSGIEIFENSESFIDRLTDITIGGEVICTLNFSPPRGASRPLDRYFKALHEYILSDPPQLRIFRSIANIESAVKARWIFERCALLVDTARVSLAVFRTKSTERLLCFHIVFKHGNGYTFLYPPVPLGGLMEGMMINNLDAAELLRREFESIWHDCLVINDAAVTMKDGLDFLSASCPELQNEQALKVLYSRAFTR
jgi:hypothetical protein